MSIFPVRLLIELSQLVVCPYLLPFAVETREVYGGEGRYGAKGGQSTCPRVQPCPAFLCETGRAHGSRNGIFVD
jgi:hypothetical protein